MEVQWHSRRRRARLSNGESYRKLKPLYTQYTVWKYKARGEQTLPSSREISENLVPQQVLSLLEREVLSYNTQLLDTYTHHRLSAARSSCRGTFFYGEKLPKHLFRSNLFRPVERSTIGVYHQRADDLAKVKVKGLGTVFLGGPLEIQFDWKPVEREFFIHRAWKNCT